MQCTRLEWALPTSPHIWTSTIWGGVDSHQLIKNCHNSYKLLLISHLPNSPIWTKLEASITFLQLETGLFQSFLTSSFYDYSFLATKTQMKQTWSETEPYSLQIRHHESQCWLPNPQGWDDRPLMTIISQHYNKLDANWINRYRLYLRVISIYDLLTYDS